MYDSILLKRSLDNFFFFPSHFRELTWRSNRINRVGRKTVLSRSKKTFYGLLFIESQTSSLSETTMRSRDDNIVFSWVSVLLLYICLLKPSQGYFENKTCNFKFKVYYKHKYTAFYNKKKTKEKTDKHTEYPVWPPPSVKRLGTIPVHGPLPKEMSSF